MTPKRAALATGLLTAVACGLAANASAATTRTVYAGPPPSTAKIAKKLIGKTFSAKYSPDINDFFQHRLTISAGDTVSFVLDGFHTVDLPGKSGKDLPLIVPGSTVSGANDAAGNPFWFNGHVPSLGLDPALLSASGGNTYNGTARVNSGLPLGPPKPFKVTFTKPGVYKYFCDVHPGMIGYIVVKKTGTKVPTAKQDAKALTSQIKTDILSAKQLAKTKLPKDHVSLGESNSHGVELYAMFPESLTVKAGTVVAFSMSKQSRDKHTATFGPVAYLKPLAGSFNSPSFSPIATYPSDNPALGPLQLSQTWHGNGFANTGVLDQDPATPVGPSEKIKFDQAGTYHFVCLIHPFMRGTVVVK